MNVDPAVRDRLEHLLFRPEMRGIGYSDFLTAAMDAYEQGDWRAHKITAHPIDKMDGGTIGYRWECSCGRSTNGRHDSVEKAIKSGQDHIA